VPKDFESLYFAQYEQTHLDIAELDELDFVSGTWLSGTTGTPKAVSVIGSGDGAVVRYVPVPTSVWDGGASYIFSGTPGMTLGILGTYYDVTCNAGQLVTTSGATPPGDNPVIAGPTTTWLVYINVDGVMCTMTSSSSASSWGVYDTSGSGLVWLVTCTDNGELVTTPSYGDGYGLATSALLDNGTFQDFDTDGTGASEEYGVIVDAYASGVVTNPEAIVRANTYRGLSLYAYTSDEAGMLWYKGALPELGSVHGELVLSEGFIPVVLHGLLSMAYGLNGDGQDLQKAGLLSKVFVAECEAIRRGFEFRWA
jgi:hypothetical protein